MKASRPGSPLPRARAQVHAAGGFVGDGEDGFRRAAHRFKRTLNGSSVRHVALLDAGIEISETAARGN
jgi:hypothetical protein